MHTLYRITNKVSGTVYFGITNNLKQRKASHKYCAKKGMKSPLYCAIRAYGWENFKFDVICEFEDREKCCKCEIILIEYYQGKTYNLHEGGGNGFSILTKSPEEIEEWRCKLKEKRAGRQPALGMHHTEENKTLFGEYGKLRWDIYGRYPDEVLDFGFTESNKRFGISKTHYYRLRKQALANAQC